MYTIITNICQYHCKYNWTLLLSWTNFSSLWYEKWCRLTSWAQTYEELFFCMGRSRTQHMSLRIWGKLQVSPAPWEDHKGTTCLHEDLRQRASWCEHLARPVLSPTRHQCMRSSSSPWGTDECNPRCEKRIDKFLILLSRHLTFYIELNILSFIVDFHYEMKKMVQTDLLDTKIGGAFLLHGGSRTQHMSLRIWGKLQVFCSMGGSRTQHMSPWGSETRSVSMWTSNETGRLTSWTQTYEELFFCMGGSRTQHMSPWGSEAGCRCPGDHLARQTLSFLGDVTKTDQTIILQTCKMVGILIKRWY